MARLAQEQRDFAVRQLSHAEAVNGFDLFLLSDAAPSGNRSPRGNCSRARRTSPARPRRDRREPRRHAHPIGYRYNDLDLDKKANQCSHAPTTARPGNGSRASRQGRVRPGELTRARRETERAEKLIQEGLGQLPDEPQFALDRVFCLCRGSYVARSPGM